MSRPYVLLSVAVSIDGHIDDTSPERLLLSNDADFNRVDEVRANSDAILIGAGTIRADNPRLLVKSEARQEDRQARGLTGTPLKVTISESGDLNAEHKFWHHGDGGVLVYSTPEGAARAKERLGHIDQVEIVEIPSLDLGALLDDLGERGVGQLMIEGGEQVHTAFLSEGLADEIQMAVAPVLVGERDAPRFLGPAQYPGGPMHRMQLMEARTVGDVALLRFRPKDEPDELSV